MLLIPITLVVYNSLRRWQEHHVFHAHGIDLPADRRGFWGYLLLYQALVRSLDPRLRPIHHRSKPPLEVTADGPAPDNPGRKLAGGHQAGPAPPAVSDQPQIQDGCDVLQVLPGKRLSLPDPS
jgi:hypothetical protein